MRLRFAIIFSFLMTAIAHSSPALAEEYFSVDSCKDIPPFYESNGYTVSEGGVTWLIAPNRTRVRLSYAQGEAGECNGIRLEAMWLIKNGSEALQAAYYYEATNPLASIVVQNFDGNYVIFLQRDIEFGPGRTKANILVNTDLLFQLVPYFQESLVQADPSLSEWWENKVGSRK